MTPANQKANSAPSVEVVAYADNLRSKQNVKKLNSSSKDTDSCYVFNVF